MFTGFWRSPVKCKENGRLFDISLSTYPVGQVRAADFGLIPEMVRFVVGVGTGDLLQGNFVNLSDTEKLLSLNEAELMTAIGAELKPLGFALDERSDSDKEKDGRKWFQRNYKLLQSKICNATVVRSTIAEGRAVSRLELVAAVTDLVGLVTTGITPSLIAVVIVRRGLSEFCAETSAA